MAEAGQPALTIDGLVGLFGPPTMPMALRQKIAADIKEVMEGDPIIKDRLTATAQIFAPGGPEEFAKSIDAQRAIIARTRGTSVPEKKFGAGSRSWNRLRHHRSGSRGRRCRDAAGRSAGSAG